MRLPAAVLACLLVALLGPALAGCDDEEDPDGPVVATQLPDDLCAVVPAGAVDRWRLRDDGHATDHGEDRSEARCTMTGRADGAPVTLEVTLTSYGAGDRAALEQRLADELAERCGALETETEAAAGAEFTHAERRCSGDQGARVTEVSLSARSQAVLTVSMAHDGPQRQLLGAEVVGISGSIANGGLTPRSGARPS